MKKEFIKYIIGLLLFGSNGVAASFIDLPSQDIVLLRSLLGSVLLLALFFLSGKKITCHHHKKDLLFIILSGVAMAADWLLLFEAYARIGVSLGMIINYCGPVLVILFSAFLFHEKISAKTITALVLAMGGAILISWQGMRSGIDKIGLLLAILSAFAYAAMVLLNKQSKKITGTENAAIQLLTTLVVVFIYVVIRNGIHIQISSRDILPLLWIGCLNTGLGCFFYFSSISFLSSQMVAICGYLEPLSAVVFAALILGEQMQALQLIGAALILFGTLLLNIRRKKQASSS